MTVDGRTLWELVEARAEATPEAVMVVDEDDRRLTFAEYRRTAERAAAGLRAMGLGEGDVVSWQLPTWLESLTLVAALSRLGVVQNPILPIYRDREVGFCVRQARSRLAIVPSVWRGFDFEAMAGRVADTEVLVVDRNLPDGDPDGLPPLPDRPDDAPVRWLFYTSGTTADPKGAQHTDTTIIATAGGMVDHLELTVDDVNGLIFPFTHIAGPIFLCAGLMTGMANVIMEAFDPQVTAEVFARHDITLAGSGTPFHMAYLAVQRTQPDTPLFPKVRAFPGGGAPKPPQLHYDLKREMGGVGILAGWGLTEVPILTMGRPSDGDHALAHTEGKALPGVELRVVTIDGGVAGPGEEGELRAKAPQMMRGYVDSSLDAEAFDDDGWFRTGDLGRIDPAGNVTITGRLKDVIIRKGENISAKEVEDLLFAHPKVADVAVIGLPDDRSGERACAVVATAEGVERLAFVEMQEYLRDEGLRNQAIPEQIEVIDALPRNPTGKVLKHELRSRYGG